MSTFIRALSNISPQQSFGNPLYPSQTIRYFGNRLSCIEPDYSSLIDPKSIRRMSRIIKMGVAAATSCLREAGLKNPDAIVTGTAYGCLSDTELFLTKLVENKEELLTPTAFIQSTHNTAGAQIALVMQCHGYNNTFVHRGFSFENALLDAFLLLEENQGWHVLVGALDEITDSSHRILGRFGLYKQGQVNNLDLFNSPSKGTIAGEGSAFFLLGSDASGSDYAKLEAVDIFYKPSSTQEVETAIRDFLSARSTLVSEISLIITGRNGDRQGDEIYDHLSQSIFIDKPSITYKQFCGEYPTSSGFALWLAAVILKSGIPHGIQTPRRILIYNHYQNIHHSLFLLSAC